MSFLFAAGSIELVNMTAKGVVLLFDVNYRVFVKEELVSKSLKEKTEAKAEAEWQTQMPSHCWHFTSSQGSLRSTFRSSCPLWLS